jgi:hypothetical protein
MSPLRRGLTARLAPTNVAQENPEAKSDYAQTLADPQIATTRFLQIVGEWRWEARQLQELPTKEG